MLEIKMMERVHENWSPDGERFSVSFWLDVGRVDEDYTTASFEFEVVSPQMLAIEDKVVSGHGYLIMNDFNIHKVRTTVEHIIRICQTSDDQESLVNLRQYFRLYSSRGIGGIVEIDGQSIHTEKDFHKAVAAKFYFGPYYGHNLNAFWDFAKTEIMRPVTLVWQSSAVSKEYLGSTFDKIVKVLEDLKKCDETFPPDKRFDYVLK